MLSTMLTRIVKHAMRETIQEFIKPDLDKLSGRMDRLEQRLDEGVARLDRRIDALTEQQIRLVEQVAALKTGFDVNATLAHRIDRLEDRVFAKAS